MRYVVILHRHLQKTFHPRCDRFCPYDPVLHTIIRVRSKKANNEFIANHHQSAVNLALKFLSVSNKEDKRIRSYHDMIDSQECPYILYSLLLLHYFLLQGTKTTVCHLAERVIAPQLLSTEQSPNARAKKRVGRTASDTAHPGNQLLEYLWEVELVHLHWLCLPLLQSLPKTCPPTQRALQPELHLSADCLSTKTYTLNDLLFIHQN